MKYASEYYKSSVKLQQSTEYSYLTPIFHNEYENYNKEQYLNRTNNNSRGTRESTSVCFISSITRANILIYTFGD